MFIDKQPEVKNNHETLKAGCVVINESRVLLVAGEEKGVWSFPKGHVEVGETLEQAAIRETREETGYNVRIKNRLPDITYTNQENGEAIRLALFEAEPIGNPGKVEESTPSAWFQIPEAKQILYKNLELILNTLERRSSQLLGSTTEL